MSEKVFVIQAIASGPEGYPYDEIVDIAVCSVDLDCGDFDTVYHNVVFYDPKALGKQKLDYLSKTAGLFAEEIYAGDPEDKVASEVMSIIAGGNVACFDAKQEFGRYMVCFPWDMTRKASVMPSVSAKLPISLKARTPSEEPGAIVKAYRRLLPNDPACVGRGRRAMHLAQMTSQLMIELRSAGKY
ncbi:MAG: hypothetical protein LBS92_07585 [Candidatus Methanoplasma sp.]|jgi:hypothetical protein|nr:hypothetical protein [Candidatus Methanoplasma sp.]